MTTESLEQGANHVRLATHSAEQIQGIMRADALNAIWLAINIRPVLLQWFDGSASERRRGNEREFEEKLINAVTTRGLHLTLDLLEERISRELESWQKL